MLVISSYGEKEYNGEIVNPGAHCRAMPRLLVL